MSKFALQDIIIRFGDVAQKAQPAPTRNDGGDGCGGTCLFGDLVITDAMVPVDAKDVAQAGPMAGIKATDYILYLCLRIYGHCRQ